MSIIPLIKVTGIWLVIVFGAVLNGTFRDKILVPAIALSTALPLSGISLAIIVFLVSLVFVPFIGYSQLKKYITIGLLWVVLTLSFEFILGHFVGGRSWQEVCRY